MSQRRSSSVYSEEGDVVGCHIISENNLWGGEAKVDGEEAKAERAGLTAGNLTSPGDAGEEFALFLVAFGPS